MKLIFKFQLTLVIIREKNVSLLYRMDQGEQNGSGLWFLSTSHF